MGIKRETMYTFERGNDKDIKLLSNIVRYLKDYITTSYTADDKLDNLYQAFDNFRSCRGCESGTDNYDIYINDDNNIIIDCSSCSHRLFTCDDKYEYVYKLLYLLNKGVDLTNVEFEPYAIRLKYNEYELNKAEVQREEELKLDVDKLDLISQYTTKKIEYVKNNSTEEICVHDTLSDYTGLNQITINNNNENEEENKTMKNTGLNLKGMFKGFEFGAVAGDMFKLSMYGVAFKNGEGYVAYDKNNQDIIDVDAMNFDNNGLIMQMPVAINAIETGDIIMHQGNPVIVNSVRTNGQIEVLQPGVAEIKTILPVKNMFGFNFVTKVMPLVDFSSFGANQDNPFGNMMPLMMMSNMMDGEMDMMQTMFMMNMMNGEDMDMQKMMPLMLLSGNDNNNNNSDMMQNIMLMNMMSGGEMDMQSMMPLMLMSQGSTDMNPMVMLMMMGGNNPFMPSQEKTPTEADITQMEKIVKAAVDEAIKNNSKDVEK